MGERKGVNKYYPPDFDYKKHGSLDRYHNSHPLRERARKLKSEGILIIRFEMPYNIWCNGCNSHIGMGVRYNAEKKKVGNYYSTIIYKFRMKCHLCNQHFEIQTDPANCDYVILSGARRKEERWNAKDNEQIEMTDHAVKKQLATDPMFKLEHSVKDKHKLQSVIPTLNEIQDIQDVKRDDYLLNKALRKTFREQKKKVEKANESDKKLLLKSSLDIKLVEENEDDKRLSKLIKFNTVTSCGAKQQDARDKIINQSIFTPTSAKQQLPLNVKLKKENVGRRNSNESDTSLNANSLGIKIGKRKLSQSDISSNKRQETTTNNSSISLGSDRSNKTENAKPFSNTTTTVSTVVSNVVSDSDNKELLKCSNVLVANYSSGEES